MAEEKDTRSRKWLITINDPVEKGITNELIEETCRGFKSFRYSCYSHEIGCENKRYHVHIFIAFDLQVRFSTIKNAFPQAHIDNCRGSIRENRDYVFKEGKWKDTEKEDSKLAGMQFEIGEMPIEIGQGRRTDLDRLEEMIDRGMTPEEIFELSIGYRNYEKQVRAHYMAKRDRETPIMRNVHVVWHVGESGTGKSYTMVKMMQERASDVYLLNDYDSGGLDLYQGQKVLFMDEFRGQLRFSTLLNMLDCYKTQIHCRYANCYSLWTEVHITSVLPPEKVYERMVEENRNIDTFKQLLRRITEIHYHYTESGEYKVFKMDSKNYKDYSDLKYQATHGDFVTLNGEQVAFVQETFCE